MQVKKRRISKKNKGFTLIELIISMVILSIVILIVASFLNIGSKSYSRANDEIKKQMETQTVMNQLADLIIESYWVERVDISTHEEALVIYAQSDISVVIYNSIDKNMYLVDCTPVEANHLSSITYTKEANLMAENVYDIKLLLTEGEMKAKKELQLEVDFEIASKVYSQVRTIYYRNQLAKPTDMP